MYVKGIGKHNTRNDPNDHYTVAYHSKKMDDNGVPIEGTFQNHPFATGHLYDHKVHAFNSFFSFLFAQNELWLIAWEFRSFQRVTHSKV